MIIFAKIKKNNMVKTNNDSTKSQKIEEKIGTRKRVNRKWLDAHGFSPLKEVRKRIEGSDYVG